MYNAKEIKEKVAKLVTPILKQKKLMLADIKYFKKGKDFFLSIYIAKEDGSVSTEDCSYVSQKLSPILDKEDFIKNSYILEVSSKGI